MLGEHCMHWAILSALYLYSSNVQLLVKLAHFPLSHCLFTFTGTFSLLVLFHKHCLFSYTPGADSKAVYLMFSLGFYPGRLSQRADYLCAYGSDHASNLMC